jgi:hypothetical protein
MQGRLPPGFFPPPAKSATRIVALDDPNRAVILKKHIARIDDCDCAEAFEVVSR